MQVRSNDGRIVRLSGKYGDCIFRTFKSGKIFATHAPTRPRSVSDPIPVRFRNQIATLNFSIVKNENSKQPMISKSVLRSRLSKAIQKDIDKFVFTMFFGEFCDRLDSYRVVRNERHEVIRRFNLHPPEELRKTKSLTHDETQAFSLFCGYDLTTPVPTPLW